MKFIIQHIAFGLCLTIITIVASPIQSCAQAPDWSFAPNDFQNTMSIILTVSDECVASEDPLDMIAAFDVNGEIRGVQLTEGSGGVAFMSIYSNSGGETILFKVYDNSTDSVYTITNYTLVFQPNQNLGFPDPIDLIFDSQSTAIGAAGMDQEVFNQPTTMLEATGSGSWLVLEGVGGSFTNNTDPQTTFTGVIGTHYTLAWTTADPIGCYGETDQVVIILVTDEPENMLFVCQDGLDNDGDGDYDCADMDCGAPDFIVITDLVLPSPISCTETLSDGSFDVTTNSSADMFSIDGGANFQTSNQFVNIISDTFHIVVLNSISGCSYSESVIIENTNDPDGDGICEIDANSCTSISEEGFETGSGIWQSGGADAELVMSSNSPAENYSFRIRSSAGEASSMSTIALDLSDKPSAKINVSFQTIALGAGEGFSLAVSNDSGGSFDTIQQWMIGAEYDNEIIYEEEVSLSSNQISSATILRFTSTGSDDTDEVFIDDIEISTCESGCYDILTESLNNVISQSTSVTSRIETNGIVGDGLDIEYTAGEYILMTEGFEVEVNAIFHAFIDGCSNDD